MLSFIAAALVFVNAPDGDTMVVRDGNVNTVLRWPRSMRPNARSLTRR